MSMPASLRQRLVQRLVARESQLRRQLGTPAVPEAGPAAEVHDRKDEAAEEAQQVVDDATRARATHELGLVTAALRRVDDGTYGTCESCGEPIGDTRLLAVPEATCCLACQTAREGPSGPRH